MNGARSSPETVSMKAERSPARLIETFPENQVKEGLKLVIGFDNLPDYYPTMYLDGYTPE